MGDKILVLLGKSYGDAVEGLGELAYDPGEFKRHIDSYKLVLFTGGEDVSPELYSHTSCGLCRCSKRRDYLERDAFKLAVKNGVKMAGICRGAQFLHVMNGGELVHHLDNHEGVVHSMECLNGDNMPVNSLHHQMIIPSNDCVVIGWAEPRLANAYFGDKDKRITVDCKETEAIIMPEIMACGVQYHPEMMSKITDGYKFFRSMVEALLETDNMEEFTNGYVRKSKNA